MGSARSNGFRDHGDGAARALGDADAAPFAIVVVDGVAVTGAELDDGVVRAQSVTVVAVEAVAAGQATARLEQGVCLRQAADHLVERRPAQEGPPPETLAQLVPILIATVIGCVTE